mmetsp:Transcript_62341/g.190535  ORF Transcript_62341/g.190535 Transcript_62341/m.190535 type:complete len:352 (+) Transcript_62341:2940-3995(+)
MQEFGPSEVRGTEGREVEHQVRVRRHCDRAVRGDLEARRRNHSEVPAVRQVVYRLQRHRYRVRRRVRLTRRGSRRRDHGDVPERPNLDALESLGSFARILDGEQVRAWGPRRIPQDAQTENVALAASLQALGQSDRRLVQVALAPQHDSPAVRRRRAGPHVVPLVEASVFVLPPSRGDGVDVDARRQGRVRRDAMEGLGVVHPERVASNDRIDRCGFVVHTRGRPSQHFAVRVEKVALRGCHDHVVRLLGCRRQHDLDDEGRGPVGSVVARSAELRPELPMLEIALRLLDAEIRGKLVAVPVAKHVWRHPQLCADHVELFRTAHALVDHVAWDRRVPVERDLLTHLAEGLE